MEGLPILNLLGGVILYIAKFLLVLIAGIAVYKGKSRGTILLFIGALSIVIGDIVGFFLTIYAGQQGQESLVQSTGISAILSGITFLFFSIGLLLYVLEKNKTPKPYQ